MKRYCTSCGSPTDYSAKKPLYCSNCGKLFDKVESVALISPIIKENTQQKLSKFRVRPNINNAEDNYETEGSEDDINHVPNINHLEVETFVEETPKENLGALLNRKPENSSKPRNKRKQKNK